MLVRFFAKELRRGDLLLGISGLLRWIGALCRASERVR